MDPDEFAWEAGSATGTTPSHLVHVAETAPPESKQRRAGGKGRGAGGRAIGPKTRLICEKSFDKMPANSPYCYEHKQSVSALQRQAAERGEL